MKLASRVVAKVWGRRTPALPFDRAGSETIGELWFTPPDQFQHFLVKYLFTSENLSVQVHPDDTQAPSGSAGKEECWLIVDAEPGARLAVGFRSPIDTEAMRSAALDGSIDKMLNWREVSSGDWFHLPPGTVHAIGAGLTIVEVQQNSDVTYRLYDYGRDRALHLDDAIAVAQGTIHASALSGHVAPDSSAPICDGVNFRVSQCVGEPDADFRDRHSGPVQIIPLTGRIRIGDDVVGPGESGFALSLDEVDFDSVGRMLLVSVPQRRP